MGRKGKMVRKSAATRSDLPPQLQTTSRVRKRLRFLATSALTDQSITGQTMAGACGGIAATTTEVVPWASTIRLRRVTIWPAVGSTAGIADVTWATDGTLFVKDEFRLTSIPQGVSIDKAVTSVPPKGTLGQFWQTASNTSTIFTISAPSGSIVDIVVDFTLSNEIAPTSITVVTAVLGQVYYLYLDGPGSHLLKPEGLPTTF